MAIQCCAFDCESNISTTKGGMKIKFFPFPTDKILYQQWSNICNIHLDGKEDKDHGSKVLCELHFDKDSFDSKNKLKTTAIPQKRKILSESEIQQSAVLKVPKSNESSMIENGNSSEESDCDDLKQKPYRLTIHIDKILAKPCPKSKKSKQTEMIVNNLQKTIRKTICSSIKSFNYCGIEDENSNICLVCEQKFTDVSELYTHLKEHFTCDICKKQFSSRKSYQKHYDLHRSGKKSFPYKCHVCDLLFETKDAISKHSHITSDQSISSESSEERVQYCKSCNITFRNETNFRKHLDSHVEEVTLRNFNQTIKSNAIGFSCRLCNTNIATIDEMNTHMKTHTKEQKT